MPCYALHILFIWQVVHVTLNRKLRVHFGYLGRFFEDFGPFQALLRVTFTTIVQFMTGRYPLHEQSVGIVQYLRISSTSKRVNYVIIP